MRHVVFFAFATLSLGQTEPSFDIAAIRLNPNTNADSNINSAPGGRFTATSVTVRELIRLAFAVQDYQIERAPGWIESERYDILAKSADTRKKDLADLRSMVRHLLAERFQLVAHRETKQAQVYFLVVGKTGPKLKEHNDGSGARTRSACGHLAGTRLSMDTIATVLSRHFGHDVINRTGLSGIYDFELDWTPDTGHCAESTDPAGLPSIFTAIQQQLGLKLESGKGPVETLIIDHVDRPSAN